MWLPFLLLHGAVLRLLVMYGIWQLWGVIVLIFCFLCILWRRRQAHIDPAIRLSYMHLFQSYGLLVAWTLAVWWVWQLFDIFWLLVHQTGFWFLWVHGMGVICWVILQKKDFITIMHRWRWFSGFLLLVQAFSIGGLGLSFDLLSALIAISMALYATLIFVLWSVYGHTPKIFGSYLFVFLQLTLLLYVVHRWSTLSMRTILWGQMYLALLYLWLWYIQNNQQHDPVMYTEEEDLLHRILRGDSVVQHQEPPSTKHYLTIFGGSLIDQLRADIVPWILALPKTVFERLWWINIIAMLVQLLFVLGVFTVSTSVWRSEFIFWCSIGLYVVNYIILQKLRIEVWGQRALVFLLINFAVYLSIYRLFDTMIVYVVLIGVCWTVFNGMLMISARHSKTIDRFGEEDYQFWFFWNLVAVCANIYFIVLLPISSQLRFVFVILYVAFQLLLIRYQLSWLQEK